MRLHPLDDEILGLEITSGLGGFASRFARGDYDFVSVDEMSDEVLGRSSLNRELTNAGGFRESLQAAGGEYIESTEALGDLVDCGEELLILCLESGMELKEIWSLHIPVGEMSLTHEGVGISQERL